MSRSAKTLGDGDKPLDPVRPLASTKYFANIEELFVPRRIRRRHPRSSVHWQDSTEASRHICAPAFSASSSNMASNRARSKLQPPPCAETKKSFTRGRESLQTDTMPSAGR